MVYSMLIICHGHVSLLKRHILRFIPRNPLLHPEKKRAEASRAAALSSSPEAP